MKRGGVPIHGHCRGRLSPTYKSWKGMIERTTNPRAVNWQRYGGRGITTCAAWLKFGNFLSDMGERPDGYTLERRDNSLGYSPDNCYWIPSSAQANNRRNNTFLTLHGRVQTLAQWASELGISQSTLSGRISYLKWDDERALSTPVQGKRIG